MNGHRTPVRASGRALRPFPELLAMVNEADAGLEGLIDLFGKAHSSHISTDHLVCLLRPMQEKLNRAANDLNDMDI